MYIEILSVLAIILVLAGCFISEQAARRGVLAWAIAIAVVFMMINVGYDSGLYAGTRESKLMTEQHQEDLVAARARFMQGLAMEPRTDRTYTILALGARGASTNMPAGQLIALKDEKTGEADIFKLPKDLHFMSRNFNEGDQLFYKSGLFMWEERIVLDGLRR